MLADKKVSSAWPGPLAGLAVVVLLAFLAYTIKLAVYDLKGLPLGIPGSALEYPLWAALVGLLCNALLKALKVYNALQPGFRTELFLKVGLVLLGITINFKLIAEAALGALPQAVIMITCVYLFCWWLGGRFKLPETLRAVMASAISICGVSAAIAAAGAVHARKQEITYITSLVILVALPMMILMPLLAGWMNLPQPVAGAWFGSNVDTTAAVMGAGKIYSAGFDPAVSTTAESIASVVKNTQNAFIGVAVFLLALYFAVVVEKSSQRPGPGVIWARFPKFVLGFLTISLLFSLGLIPAPVAAAKLALGTAPTAGNALLAMKDWAFCLAFVAMGLNVSLADLKQMGWKPVLVFLITTVFNTLLALAVSWLIFSVLLPIR
jgi:uncharacterized membrane protein YadS